MRRMAQNIDSEICRWPIFDGSRCKKKTVYTFLDWYQNILNFKRTTMKSLNCCHTNVQVKSTYIKYVL